MPRITGNPTFNNGFLGSHCEEEIARESEPWVRRHPGDALKGNETAGYLPSEAAPQTIKLELNSYSALHFGSAPPAASPIESLNGGSRTRNLTSRQHIWSFKDSRGGHGAL